MNSDTYILTETDTGFVFCTDTGLNYNIYLSKLSGVLFGQDVDPNCFIFGFEMYPNNEKKQYDHKIANTICKAVKELFDRDESIVLLYVCDPSQDKQRQRKIAFCKWHKEHLQDNIKKYDATYEGIVYMSCMYSQTHTNIDIIESNIGNLQMIGK